MRGDCGSDFDLRRGECLCCEHLVECFEKDENVLKPKRRDRVDGCEDLFDEIVCCICAAFVTVCAAALVVYIVCMQLKGV